MIAFFLRISAHLLVVSAMRLGSPASVVPGVTSPPWACPLSEAWKTTGAITVDTLRRAENSTVGLHLKAVEAAEQLQVLAVTGASLSSLIDMHTEDLLVVFYAPWCPHCKAFVMQNGGALEVLNRRVVAMQGPKPKIVKFDSDAHVVPSGFAASYVPAIYLVRKDGTHTEYEHDPNDVDRLQAFALSGSAAELLGFAAIRGAGAPVSWMKGVAGTQVGTPTWACAVSEEPNGGVSQNATVQLHALAQPQHQQVLAVSGASLSSLIDARTTDILVVFYAPWCPHCQDFVIGIGAGIEVLNQRINARQGLKPKVAKFDTDAHAVPSGFSVSYVPAVYLVRKDGTRTEYPGDPSDLARLEAFALGGGSTAGSFVAGAH